MKISVLVPTYRRPSDLRRCLAALAAQTRPAEEVIVIVRDTDAETQEFLAACLPAPPNLRLIPVCASGVLAAMTAGLEAAAGDIIALTDDDTAPFPDWLERIEACFAAHPNAGGVGGRDWQANDHRSREIVGKIQWHGRVIGNHHLGVGDPREVDLLKGANCAYRAQPLKEIGFEARLRGDGAQVHWELALGLAMRRAGWKLIYDPAIALDHFIARRVDDDANHRGFFSASGLSNSVYNETLVLLTFLPPLRKAAFLFWALLVGTWAEPGPLQVPRLLVRRDKHVWRRLCAASAGRLAAIFQPGVQARTQEGDPKMTASLWDKLNKPYYLFRPRQVLLRLKRRLLNYQPAADYEEVALPWGLTIRVRPSDTIGAAIFRTGLYDPAVSETLWRLLDPGETAVDAGANIGHMTSVMAKRVGREGRVISFEPHPQVFEELAFNARSWTAPELGRVTLREMGLSKETGTADLHVSPEFIANRGTSSLEAGDGEVAGSSVTHPVEIGRLDDILGDIPFVGVMKVDVEGHELPLLQGASRLLTERRIRDIVFEDHGLYPSPVTDFLEQQGYRIFSIEQGPLAVHVLPAQANTAHYKYEAASYLATLDTPGALKRLRRPGYQILRVHTKRSGAAAGLAAVLILLLAAYALVKRNRKDDQ